MHNLRQNLSRNGLRRIDCVNALVRKLSETGEQVLLVWNADWRPPSWSLPGGSREPEESLTDAVAREVKEETGLEIALRGLLDVHEKIGLGGRIHLVVFTFAGEVTGGSLIHDGRGEPEVGGVSQAGWFPVAEARHIPRVARVLALVPSSAVGASCTCDRLSRVHQVKQSRPA